MAFTLASFKFAHYTVLTNPNKDVLLTLEPILDVVLRIWTSPEIQDGGQNGRHLEMITP